MAKKEIVTYSQQTFENIKHTDENGTEFWYARELQKALEYTEYGKFLPVIRKAIEACRKTGFDEGNHFAHVSEPDCDERRPPQRSDCPGSNVFCR